jgi:hypothetical protein
VQFLANSQVVAIAVASKRVLRVIRCGLREVYRKYQTMANAGFSQKMQDSSIGSLLPANRFIFVPLNFMKKNVDDCFVYSSLSASFRLLTDFVSCTLRETVDLLLDFQSVFGSSKVTSSSVLLKGVQCSYFGSIRKI